MIRDVAHQAMETMAIELALQLLAAARMAAVLAGLAAFYLDRQPAACPFRSGPLHDAYFSGRYQAYRAVQGDSERGER